MTDAEMNGLEEKLKRRDRILSQMGIGRVSELGDIADLGRETDRRRLLSLVKTHRSFKSAVIWLEGMQPLLLDNISLDLTNPYGDVIRFNGAWTEVQTGGTFDCYRMIGPTPSVDAFSQMSGVFPEVPESKEAQAVMVTASKANFHVTLTGFTGQLLHAELTDAMLTIFGVSLFHPGIMEAGGMKIVDRVQLMFADVLWSSTAEANCEKSPKPILTGA